MAFAPVASAAPKSVVNHLGSEQPGALGGHFSSPRGVAVNESGAGEVPPGTFYVVDTANNRVQQFGPTGEFVRTWGWGVKDGEREFEICKAAASCQAGIAGSEAGQFGNNGAQGVAVDQETGTVYVADQSFSGRRIDSFTANGIFIGAFGWHVRVSGGADALQFCTAASGCQAGTTGAAGGQFGSAIGELAVAPVGSPNAGHIYVANKTARRVDEFEPVFDSGVLTSVSFVRAFGWDVEAGGSTAYEVCTVAANCKQGVGGPELGQFASFGSPSDVAVDSEGNVFALDAGNKRVEEFDSAATPIAASFGAAALSATFGTGELLNIAIDPSEEPNHLLVSGKRSAQGEAVAIVELDHSGEAPVVHGEELTPTSANGLAVAPAAIGGNVYLSVASSGTLQGVYVLNEPPVVAPVTVFSGTSARFEGEVVSNELEVEYHFEYSVDGSSWQRVPSEDVKVGPEPGTIQVSQDVGGLTGSQLYYVRLVQNRPEGGGVATSAATTFTTLAAAPAISGTIVSPTGDGGATFYAYLDPQNESTGYYFEYGLGDCSAIPNPCTALPTQQAAGAGMRLVAMSVSGLQPGTVYHYRLVAANSTGTTAGAVRIFESFAPGAELPDDRAYELVTPPDTGSVVPTALGFGEGELGCFDTFLATADGNDLAFASKGGSLPGLPANGSTDLYEAVRGPAGWTTLSRSATGSQTTAPIGGLCLSPDHLHSTLAVNAAPFDQGSLAVEGQLGEYLREPDGSYSLVGQGSLATDPEAVTKWVSPGEAHVVFTSEYQLEPDAPEYVGFGSPWHYNPVGRNAPVDAVYDRIPGGPTRVASLLPGDATPNPELETVFYLGASFDGSGIVFAVEEEFEGKTTYYERRNGTTTVPVATGPLPGSFEFGGVSSDGSKVVYVQSDLPLEESSEHQRGDLFLFDANGEATTQVTAGASAALVNVSDDASHIYFTSKVALTGEEKNDEGDVAQAGQDNLYVWDEAGEETHFIAVLDPRDVAQHLREGTLTSWTERVVSARQTTNSGRADDPSRTTPDGSVLVFESHGPVTGYDSGGKTEIYRYDGATAVLDCVSCPPPGIPPSAFPGFTNSSSEIDAALQPDVAFAPTAHLIHIQNVTDDGEEVFFQTQSPLVPKDVNGTWDVYEWKQGQAYLITSGQSSLPSFLYAMSPSGSDVFFTTTERLVPQDASTITSVYDARVGGGFPVAASSPPCTPEDTCQGEPGVAPSLSAPGSASLQQPAIRGPRHKKRHHKRRHRRYRRKHDHRASHHRRTAR